MISPGAGPGVEVEVAATLKCCGARARVLSTQGFAAAPQPELCGLRSGCGRRACAGKAGPRLCTSRRGDCGDADLREPESPGRRRAARLTTGTGRCCGAGAARTRRMSPSRPRPPPTAEKRPCPGAAEAAARAMRARPPRRA